VGQGAHFLAGFCHKTVVFGAAFSDARFAPPGPKGIEVTKEKGQSRVLMYFSLSERLMIDGKTGP